MVHCIYRGPQVIVREYGLEMLQSDATDKPTAPCGSDKEQKQKRDIQNTTNAKATSPLFPSGMIAKLDRTQSAANKART